jgi:transcriptional regulator with XRE-family HTH domain
MSTESLSTFGSQLRGWREIRDLSQLDLGLAADVSARHISFLETGRSQPSRSMVVRLAQVLDVPLRERNELLLAAGFAPRYGERSLSDDELDEVRIALRFLLDAHDPYPAFVLDRHWNVALRNRGYERLLAALGVDERSSSNVLDLVFQPGPLRERVVNWTEVALAVLRRLRRQMARYGRDEELQRRFEQIRSLPDVARLESDARDEGAAAILVPLEVRFGDRVLSWFNTLTVLGSPGDATLEELVIETLFPADEATRRVALEMARTTHPA